MSGKSTLLIVLGFSLIFLIGGSNLGKLTIKSVDNSVLYYEENIAHNIAKSGANMALNQIFINSDWRDGYKNIALNDGDLTVEAIDIGTDLIQVTSYGYYNDVTKRTVVKLQPSSFAKFAWYTGIMNSKEFITGDTIWGPFHTQSGLNVNGAPVFWGKVTSKKGLSMTKGSDPKFYGGFETGVDIEMPVNYQFDEQQAAALNGKNPDDLGISDFGDNGVAWLKENDLWMRFNSDGTVTYRIGTGSDTSTYSLPVTKSLTDLAPNGVIYANKGNMYVSGTLKGKVSIVSGESSGSGHGNIYLVDNLNYTTAPMVWDATEKKYVLNESCEDLLGIMATNNIIIADNDANVANKDIRVDGSLFTAQGGVIMENKNIPPSGSLYLRGGIISAKEELLGIFDKGVLNNGYNRNVIFDERFLLSMPPEFPVTDKFEIVSWYE